MPETAAAHAPVPQAKVSPTPRSNTRKRACFSSIICIKPALTRAGKRACDSTCGPIVATSAVMTSGTTVTACGLPMFTTSI